MLLPSMLLERVRDALSLLDILHASAIDLDTFLAEAENLVDVLRWKGDNPVQVCHNHVVRVDGDAREGGRVIGVGYGWLDCDGFLQSARADVGRLADDAVAPCEDLHQVATRTVSADLPRGPSLVTHRKTRFSVFAQISATSVNYDALDALVLSSSSHQAAPDGVLAV